MKDRSVAKATVYRYRPCYTDGEFEWVPDGVKYQVCWTIKECWDWIKWEYRQDDFILSSRKDGESSWRSRDGELDVTITFGNTFTWEKQC